ncbi:FAD-dependent monooxygenase [Roseospirillum parvum]|uniref:Anthraniloyl-CoA monooxygenase n=1 Tax=Roseospirillum parvum TaxID=83401 RepID=A0A1G7WU47_9PROT|nr:FAD-dependent monooxygenase [Roseospirillum parvum]SDG75448.1 anthraniloyl-CoA monooxygenase [Roseospirillum parvum]
MRIVIVGAGPAGLTLALTLARRRPGWPIQVFERAPAGQTWGFGVVFAEAGLNRLAEALPGEVAALRARSVSWAAIDIQRPGTCHRFHGPPYRALPRLGLLQVLEQAARTAGVTVTHGAEIRGPDDPRLAGADLLVAADGIASPLRQAHAEALGSRVEAGANRFLWAASGNPGDAFRFLVADTAHGPVWAHAYPYSAKRATFIVECAEATWRALGLAPGQPGAGPAAGPAADLGLIRRLFPQALGAAPLEADPGGWRRFPVVTNARWSAGRLVLLGDALHSLHFSIGSGSRLAMEDALALAEALDAAPTDPAAACQAFEAARRPASESLARAARASMRWFESLPQAHAALDGPTFAAALLTRSRRVTVADLAATDPGLATTLRAHVATRAGAAPDTPPLFTPLRLRGLTLANRVAVSPMCQYRAEDGVVGDWHLVHLGARAVGGAGLIVTEATAISPEGRITPGCAGLYTDAQAAAWRRIVEFIKAESGAAVCLQLGHAGRKAACQVPWIDGGRPLRADEGAWPLLAPSALPWDAASQTPRAMDAADMDRLTEAFVAATRRAAQVGFDMVELHLAHGYLLSSFLSPLTNRRDDDHGGEIEHRLRFPLAVVRAVRAAWPAERPLAARLSATDWAPGGLTPKDAAAIARALKSAGVDLLDVSAGGVVADQRPERGRLIQAPLAAALRLESGLPTMAVGGITSLADAESLLVAGRADVVALARMHLLDPGWTLSAAHALGWPVAVPDPYRAVAPGGHFRPRR